MCLVVNINKSTFKAKRNILGYKVLEVVNYGDKKDYITPYRGTRVQLNVELKEFGDTFTSVRDQSNINKMLIGSSAIHIYRFFITALICKIKLNFKWKEHGTTHKIFRAIIPKGTMYINGKDNCGRLCRATKKVIYKPIKY